MRMPSIVGVSVLAAACTLAARPVEAQTNVVLNRNVVLNSLNLRDVNYNAATRTLTAAGGTLTGTFAGLPFTTNITRFVLRELPGNRRECSILNLELQPIQIALLGLRVDTSPICLDITAFRGQGLLGNLLCGLAGGNLGLLGSPDLLSGLSDILTQALGRAKPPKGGGNGGGGNNGGDDSVCSGECEVLNLVVGPLTLNLLGVRVELDNCNDGPVQVCISATASEGLLGQLLCGLADGGLLDGISLADLLTIINGILAGGV